MSLSLAEYGDQIGFEATTFEFDRSALTNWATLPEILIIISYNTISYNDDNGGVSVERAVDLTSCYDHFHQFTS